MNDGLIFPKKPFGTHGGVRPPHMKRTAGCASIVMPPPQTVSIPMSQHIGAPCTPCVAPGDKVRVGTLIGDSTAPVSAPVHASVSGTVKSIGEMHMPNGTVTKTVVIESDGEMTPADFTPPTVTNAAELVAAVRASGLVGLGGAGFPAAIKLTVPEGKSVDTLIINAAECEPYLTADHRELLENSWDVLSGIYAVKEILGIRRVIIGIEGNKPDAIKLLTEIADNRERDPNDEVRVLKLRSSYPQGAEKMLIRACTGRHVPPGKLPSDVGCIVMNVTSIAFLARYLKTGAPLTTKRITVEGSAVSEPKNLIVPIGTPVHDVLEFCGLATEPRKLLYGGPMMGTVIIDDSMVVLKNTNGLLAMAEKEATLPAETACIRCGRCVNACPMSLSPLLLAAATARRDAAALVKLDVASCMECGCCAYVCPAKRNLVQSMRLGKAISREKKA